MRLWSLMVVLMAALMVAACSADRARPANGSAQANGTGPGAATAESPQQSRNTSPDNVRRVTIAELRDMMEQNKAVAVDVRGTSSYNQEHIKGSLDIPENQLSARINELPKDKMLVFYCS